MATHWESFLDYSTIDQTLKNHWRRAVKDPSALRDVATYASEARRRLAADGDEESLRYQLDLCAQAASAWDLIGEHGAALQMCDEGKDLAARISDLDDYGRCSIDAAEVEYSLRARDFERAGAAITQMLSRADEQQVACAIWLERFAQILRNLP